MAFTVTVTGSGSVANDITVLIKVLTGVSAIQPGAVASGNVISATVTPLYNNSWIYCAVNATSATATTLGGQTIQQNFAGGGDRFFQLRTTAYQVAGTPFTVGLGTGGPLGLAAAEIVPSGTMLEDSSSPAGSGLVAASTWTSAAFTPPTGSVMVVSIAARGGSGVLTEAISDTSGLGLNWTQQAAEVGTGLGYAGIWTSTPIPSALQRTVYQMRMFP